VLLLHEDRNDALILLLLLRLLLLLLNCAPGVRPGVLQQQAPAQVLLAAFDRFDPAVP
jgi:hypothetical protein